MYNSRLKRIAFFFDGTFYSKVSTHYRYNHPRKSHLSFTGIHDYARQRISEREQEDTAFCQVVESHFFRGRFSLTAAKQANTLESDRYLDQLLMYAGIITHYYPMNEKTIPPEEKGIDVWLSLEAYDLAIHKGFDVVVLFAGDQDFVPLVRKLNGIGTRVMILAFDVQGTDQHNKTYYINTSQRLIDESSYPIILSQEIDSRTAKSDKFIDGLFLSYFNSNY